MIFKKETAIGEFIERPNRFVAYIKLNNEIIKAHVPNTGRLKEILIPGVKCLIRLENNPERQTQFSLIGAWKGDLLINFDSQIPNPVVEEALLNGNVRELDEYDVIEREKTYGASRFDFRLKKEGLPDYYLEVKGVTLENSGIMSFPDAKTERGSKHLRELAEAKKRGFGAGVLFLIQVDKANYFTPNTAIDPYFSESLKYAKDNGVDILAYTCEVTTKSITLLEPLKVVV